MLRRAEQRFCLGLRKPIGVLLLLLLLVLPLLSQEKKAVETLGKAETAIAHLSDREFSVREKATAELLKLRERAYPALVRAAQSKELEVVRRAEELIDKIRELVPESALVVREYDVIHTAHSKLSGKMEAATLHV